MWFKLRDNAIAIAFINQMVLSQKFQKGATWTSYAICVSYKFLFCSLFIAKMYQSKKFNTQNTILVQHWEPWSPQFPSMCFEHNSSKCSDKGIRQWGENQDMARWNGISNRDTIREHTNGECQELHNRRPILLLTKGLSERNIGGVCERRVVQDHKGYLWCEDTSNPLCLQWCSGLHKYNTRRCWAFASWRRVGGWPILLECLWDSGDLDNTSY